MFHMSQTLNFALLNKNYKIEKIYNSSCKRRLLEMGILPGTIICVKNRACGGFPISILVKGYFLALSKNECELIEIRDIIE